jgi:hypothetical protein
MKKQPDLIVFTKEEMTNINKFHDRLYFALFGITRIDFSNPMNGIYIELCRTPKTVFMLFRTYGVGNDHNRFRIQNNTIDLNKLKNTITRIQDSINLDIKLKKLHEEWEKAEEIKKNKQSQMKKTIDVFVENLITVKEVEGSALIKTIIHKALWEAIDSGNLVLDIEY